MGVPASCRAGRPSLTTPSPWEGREERAGRACGGLHGLGVRRALGSEPCRAADASRGETLRGGEPAPAIDPLLAGLGPLTPGPSPPQSRGRGEPSWCFCRHAKRSGPQVLLRAPWGIAAIFQAPRKGSDPAKRPNARAVLEDPRVLRMQRPELIRGMALSPSPGASPICAHDVRRCPICTERIDSVRRLSAPARHRGA